MREETTTFWDKSNLISPYHQFMDRVKSTVFLALSPNDGYEKTIEVIDYLKNMGFQQQLVHSRINFAKAWQKMRDWPRYGDYNCVFLLFIWHQGASLLCCYQQNISLAFSNGQTFFLASQIEKILPDYESQDCSVLLIKSPIGPNRHDLIQYRRDQNFEMAQKFIHALKESKDLEVKERERKSLAQKMLEGHKVLVMKNKSKDLKILALPYGEKWLGYYFIRDILERIEFIDLNDFAYNDYTWIMYHVNDRMLWRFLEANLVIFRKRIPFEKGFSLYQNQRRDFVDSQFTIFDWHFGPMLICYHHENRIFFRTSSGQTFLDSSKVIPVIKKLCGEVDCTIIKAMHSEKSMLDDWLWAQRVDREHIHIEWRVGGEKTLKILSQENLSIINHINYTIRIMDEDTFVHEIENLPAVGKFKQYGLSMDRGYRMSIGVKTAVSFLEITSDSTHKLGKGCRNQDAKLSLASLSFNSKDLARTTIQSSLDFPYHSKDFFSS